MSQVEVESDIVCCETVVWYSMVYYEVSKYGVVCCEKEWYGIDSLVYYKVLKYDVVCCGT